MSEKLRVRVDIDEFDIPGNRFHCAIANALAEADHDIIRPKVDEDVVRYTRRSNGLTYLYATPRRAAEFVREFDRKLKDPRARVREDALRPFYLTLSEANLIEVKESGASRGSDIAREKRRALKRAPEAVRQARPAPSPKSAEAKAASTTPRKSPSTAARRSPSQAWRV